MSQALFLHFIKETMSADENIICEGTMAEVVESFCQNLYISIKHPATIGIQENLPYRNCADELTVSTASNTTGNS
jgi:hypothetical protein